MLIAPFVRKHAYYGEIMADKFASYYGFGKDLVTALDKLHDQTKGAGIKSRFMEIPIYSHIQELTLLPLKFVVDLTDEHPATQARYKNVVDGLKDDLNQPGISPKLKKQLQADIKETENTVEEVLENGKNVEDARFLENFMRSFLYHACGGDLRYLLNKKTFDTEADVQKTYIKNTKIK